MENNSQSQLGMRQRQSTFIQFARSREQLIEEQKDMFQKQDEFAHRRRTKIVATIGKKTSSYEIMRKLCLAGANSFLLNLGYLSNQDVQNMHQYREKIEQEFNMRIPLTTVLKGTLTRIGDLTNPEIQLKKGQTYRIIIKKTIIGDNCICSIDDENLHKKVRIGDKLLADYGQVSFTITGMENSDKTLEILREENQYDDDFQKPRDIKIISKLPHVFANNSDDQTEESIGGNDNQNENSGSQRRISHFLEKTSSFNNKVNQNNQIDSVTNELNADEEELNKYANNYLDKEKKKKIKIYKVLVCNVDSDCSIIGFKPIFLYPKKQHVSNIDQHKQNMSLTKHESIQERKRTYKKSEDDEESSSDSQSEEILTPKDINDIDAAIRTNVDVICVSNVKTVEDIKTVREIVGKQSTTRIIIKVQTKEAVENFDRIIKYVDGIILARSYLVIHYPVEKLFMIFKSIIQKCHSSLKPVQVSCNILESMVSTLLPTTTEVGEISNLVEQFVDGIILSQETTVGDFPVETIETLSRICIAQENEQIKKLMENQNVRSPITIQSSAKSANTILNTIIFCVIEAVYRLNASCVVAFSQTGSTIVKMSKLRTPCPILAIIPNEALARNVSNLAGVQGRYYNIRKDKVDFEKLIPQIIENAKKQKIVKKGEFVVITMFENEQKGSTNTMKIIVVD